MFEIAVSAISSFLLLSLSFLVIAKERSTANFALGFSLMLLAFVEMLGCALLDFPDYSPGMFTGETIMLYFESLMPMVFLFLGLTHARQFTRKDLVPWVLPVLLTVAFPLSVFWMPVDEFFYSPDIQSEKMLFLGHAGYWFYMGIMVFCIISLVNIEATFAASSGISRWRIKFEVVGIIAALGVLTLYFSQALLYRTIDLHLMPVRSGVMILAALLIGYSRFFRSNGVRLSVSRHVLYRSLTLLVIGMYLLALGIVSGGMRSLGISFSREMTVFVAFAAGMALLLALISEKLRRKTKVYISKHFYAHKYDYRDQWLKFTDRLSSCKTIGDVEGVILATCREAFDLRGASLYLPGKESNVFELAAGQGMPKESSELRMSDELRKYFVEEGRVFNSLDTEYIPDPDEASFILETESVLIVPLVGNKAVVGLLVFGERLSKEPFIYEDYDLMKTLACQATLSIMNFSLSEELAETRETAALAKLSSFVVHDLKNLASSLSLLLDNAEKFMGEPEFQRDTLLTVKNTIKKMGNLIHKLRNIPQKHSLSSTPVDLDTLARETVRDLLPVRPEMHFICQGGAVTTMADAEEMKKVILNLLINAADATKGKGMVKVITGHEDNMAYLWVEDSGTGIHADFMKNHLFKPFRTTKEKGLGIGLYQCKLIVEAHGGRIEVESRVGKGSTFKVYLPAHAVQCAF